MTGKDGRGALPCVIEVLDELTEGLDVDPVRHFAAPPPTALGSRGDRPRRSRGRAPSTPTAAEVVQMSFRAPVWWQEQNPLWASGSTCTARPALGARSEPASSRCRDAFRGAFSRKRGG